MAKRVEGVTEKLLLCAKEEFIECGYENASLRTIAEKAGSSIGAIYIRYPDKESLYLAVIRETADNFCQLLSRLLEEFEELPREKQIDRVVDYSDDGFPVIIDFIYQEFDTFKLLFTVGEKTAAQNFMHRVVEIDISCTMNYIKRTGNDAMQSGRLTSELAHLLSSAFYSGLFEIVVHDMPKDKAVEHIQRMRRFYNAGWKTIFTGDDADEGMD